jgi:hypothetical protein
VVHLQSHLTSISFRQYPTAIKQMSAQALFENTSQEDYATSLSVPMGPLRSSRVTLVSFDVSRIAIWALHCTV